MLPRRLHASAPKSTAFSPRSLNATDVRRSEAAEVAFRKLNSFFTRLYPSVSCMLINVPHYWSRLGSVLRYIARQPTAEDLKRIAKHRRRMEKRCTCTCHHNAGADAADGDCDGDQAANTSADQRATHENDDENGNGNENGNEECGSAASPAQDADSDSDLDSDSCCEAECHCEHNATGSDKAAAGGGGGGDGEGEQCCTCRAPPPAALVEHEDIYSILSKLRIVPQASKLDRLGRLPEDARVRLPAAAAAPTLTLTPGHEQQCAIAPAPAPSRRAPGSPAKHSSAADHRGELSDDEELEFEDFDD